MTDYIAEIDSRWSATDLALPVYGKTAGRGVPPPGTKTLAINIGALLPANLGGSGYTFVDGGTTAAGTSNYLAERVDEISMGGGYWFETVHLLPRAGVDFGNIVTVTDDRFELFNAFRYTDITLLNIVNNALPGVEFPDLSTPPTVLGAMSSFLDPLSANLAPLAEVIRALAEGLPNFDTTVDFQLGSGVGTLFLGVRGNRIALLTADFNGGLQEVLQWKTDVLPKKDASEQRIATRKNPRQLFNVNLFLTDVQRQVVQALLFGWQGMTVALPIKSETMLITTAITGGAVDTAQVDSTDYLDLRIGGLAVVLKDDTTFDVLTVLSKTSTSVTFDQTIVQSYDVGDEVIPVRLTVIDESVRGQRHPVNLEQMKVKFKCIENNTGAPTADTSAFSSYGGKVLLDDFNFIRGPMAETFEQKVFVTDSETGILSQNTSWDQHKRGHIKGFLTTSRQDLWNIRRLLYAIRGRQVSFYIPTFIEDMTPTQDLVSGNDKMTISWIGYSRFIQDREPKATFKITFTDGTSLVRVVQSSEVLSATEERLTLDTTWTSNKTVAEVQRIQFYELVRFDTDNITIEHSSVAGRARIAAPVKAATN